MKSYKLLLPFVLLAFTFVTCKTKKAETKVEDHTDLLAEVMQIHDEVMPEMATIKRMEKELKEWVAMDESVHGEEGNKVLSELKMAGEAMWDWMHEFKQPDSLPEDIDVKKYLEEEKVKITRVSNMMKNAIQSAKNILEDDKG